MSEQLKNVIEKYKLEGYIVDFLTSLEYLFTAAKNDEIHKDYTMMEIIEETTKDFQHLLNGLTEKEQFLFCVGVVFRETGIRVAGV